MLHPPNMLTSNNIYCLWYFLHNLWFIYYCLKMELPDFLSFKNVPNAKRASISLSIRMQLLLVVFQVVLLTTNRFCGTNIKYSYLFCHVMLSTYMQYITYYHMYCYIFVSSTFTHIRPLFKTGLLIVHIMEWTLFENNVIFFGCKFRRAANLTRIKLPKW